MTNRPPLNPPQMPLCPEYASMYYKACLDKIDKDLLQVAIEHHRASCPVCQARKAEFDELASKAREPEVRG